MKISASDLLIIPCSAAKKGGTPRLQPRRISEFISSDMNELLMKTRHQAFSQKKNGLYIYRDSQELPALDLYSGGTYKVAGFYEHLTGALAKGMHCLILSAGYGLLRPEEPINDYNARIPQTRVVWRGVLANVLNDYILLNKIGRVFVSCAAAYSGLIKNKLEVRQSYWCEPHVPASEGGALRKVPIAVGMAVVELLSGSRPSLSCWQPPLN